MENPYKRIEEINAELEVLEIKEKEFKKRTWKLKPKKLEDIESSIMFLLFERMPIEDTIKYFQKKELRFLKSIIKEQQGLGFNPEYPIGSTKITDRVKELEDKTALMKVRKR